MRHVIQHLLMALELSPDGRQRSYNRSLGLHCGSFFLALCTLCSSGNQAPGSSALCGPGDQTRGARKSRKLGPSCQAPTLTPSDEHGTRRTGREREWRTHRATLHSRYVSHQATGSPIQFFGEVRRLSLKLFLVNVMSTRKDPVN